MLTVNLQINYTNENNHELFLEDFYNTPILSNNFLGDGHGTTDFDFTSHNLADKNQIMAW